MPSVVIYAVVPAGLERQHVWPRRHQTCQENFSPDERLAVFQLASVHQDSRPSADSVRQRADRPSWSRRSPRHAEREVVIATDYDVIR